MIYINHFLDTNVIIGFIYTFNSLYEYSKEIFSKNDEYYYSKNVEIEVEEVFDRKNEEFKIFFRKILNSLKKFKNDLFISNSQIHIIINRFNKIGKLNLENMHNTFERLWKHFDFGENQEIDIIINNLEIILDEFFTKHSKTKKYIFNIMKEIPTHKTKDEEILQMIKEKQLRKLIHDEDEDILFDLNEYAKHHPELDLCFVS